MDPAFLAALRFYLLTLTLVMSAVGFLSIIGLSTGWISPTTPYATPDQRGVLPIGSGSSILADGPTALMSQMIPVDPGLTYDLSAEVRSIAPQRTSDAWAITYLGVITYDQSGKELKGGPGQYRYGGALKYYLYSTSKWRRVKGFLSGEGDETHNQFRPGTRYIRVVALLNYKTGDGESSSASMSTEIRNVFFGPRIIMTLDD